jgi:hypothetical protein
MAQGFLVVRLARLAAQHPGLDIEVATDLRLVSLSDVKRTLPCASNVRWMAI